MSCRLLFATLPLALLASSLASAQGNNTVAPTIPESQIVATTFSSPYEFLSAATSVDDFQIKAAELAATNAESEDIKAFAAASASAHAMMTKGLIAAGKTDKVEIAQPSVDGEQKGLLGKLEALKGAEFDRAYLDSEIFIHQRAIAMYRGYAPEPNALGAFAAANLPKLVDHYNELIAMAQASGQGESQQEPAKQ